SFPSSFRTDYCEIYCGGTCNNTACEVIKKVATTADYQIILGFLVINFKWTNKDFNGWNIPEISNATDVELVRLTVTEVPSGDDMRFKPGVHYFRHLGIRGAEKFEISCPSLTVFETQVNSTSGSKKLTFKYLLESADNSGAINAYIRESSDNVENVEFYYQDTFKRPTLHIMEKCFERKTNLKKIVFSWVQVEKLTETTFDDIMSLEVLIFNNVVLENLAFLSSTHLQESLKYIIIDKIGQKVDLKIFDKYSKLEIIESDYYKRSKNVTAFICGKGQETCDFTMGTNGIACPSKCQCIYYRNYFLFDISCEHLNLKEIPPIPTPIQGEGRLQFRENHLTQLPHNSLPGYADLKLLDVAYNQLTSLNISHLPKSPDFLDISFNLINTMSEEVVQYLANVSKFYQFGNQWIFYCDEGYLLDFFWKRARYIRIMKDKFEAVFENLDQLFNVKFLMDRFELHKDGLYYVALEDDIISYYNVSNIIWLMEELHNLIWNFSAEFDEVILYHLGAACPYRCSCCLDGDTGQFIVNCISMNLYFYPRLPNLIPHNVTLFIDFNNITKIDNSMVFPGHGSIQKLHMSNNGLTKFPLYLMPENITYLDIRNNSIKTLEDGMIAFLRYREGITEVELSGNPWECKCEAKLFLTFLKEKDPMTYNETLDRCNIYSDECPEVCVCCLDNSDSPSLVVDCSGKGLREIPQLPLIYLDLSNNALSVMKASVRNFLENRTSSQQMVVKLTGNPWICSCEEIDFLRFVNGQAKSILNASEISCGDTGKSMIEIDESDLCPSAFIYYVSLIASAMVIILAINFFIYFRQPILIWFYEHEVCLSLATRQELDQEKKFDAFLAFTHKDEDLVEEFVERLENGKHNFNLCFYLRDWLVGESIPDCINRSVKDSRRIIILMTNHFLKSTWGRLEFRLALHATSKDRCKRLIVVVYPDVENFDELDSELRTYMVLNTYLERNNPNFWSKLIYSMP
ncbi:hypothetical protein KR009_008025, partial [Drosophila setifemur]